MIDRERLFREEALEFRARSRETPGTVVRLGAPWIRWSYRLSLALVAVGVVLAIVLHTTTTTTGAAVVNGRERTFSALLPAVVAPQLRTAERMELDLANGTTPRLATRVTHAEAVAPNAAVRGLPRPQEPSILLRGRVTGSSAGLPDDPRVAARATVVLRSERVGEVIWRQVKGMFGGSGAGT